MKMKTIAMAVIAIPAITLFACNKGLFYSTLHVRMTDAPAAFTEVNVDLLEVNVKFAKDTSSWVAMNTAPGVYNLLGLQNGIDTLIAQGTYSSDVVKEIRLVLGTNNTIVADGQTYPLVIPSGAESGLKIKVNKALMAALETMVIDFDAALSISEESDGYKLRPVIKLK